MIFHRYTATAGLLTLATASTSSPKRGLCFAYNNADPHPEDHPIWPQNLTWYYNYLSAPTEDYKHTPNFEFVPMFWGAPRDGFSASKTPFLDSITTQLSAGANISHVLGFNEPDGPFRYGGSEITPETAAVEWKRQMEPLREKHGIKLGTPATTGSPRGIRWLTDFFAFCDGGCHADFLAVHFYGNFQGLADHVGQLAAMFPALPIWVTEWSYSHQELLPTQGAFNDSLRMFDSWSNITRYAYFGAFRADVSNVGPNVAMLTEHGELTEIGSWYMGRTPTKRSAARSRADVRELKGCILGAVAVTLVAGFLATW